MRSCKELAERHAETALGAFGRDGELAPAILLFDAKQEMVCSVLPVLNEENHGMPGALGAVGSVLGMLFEARWIVLCSEIWVYESQSEEDVSHVRRGDLEKRAHGGDKTVENGLLISAFDMEDIEASYTLTYNCDQSFRRTDSPGIGDGDIADCARWLAGRLREVNEGRPPGKAPMFLVQMALDRLAEYVAAAMVYGEAVDGA